VSQQFIDVMSQHSEHEGLKPFILACIPAYNEEKNIGKILDQAFRHVEHVIVCDDGSTDGTNEISRSKGATVVRNPHNMGKGRALQSCFRLADRIAPDVIVMMDADGQHNPEDIPRLVAPILDGEADLVIGSRYVEGSSIDAPLYRRVGLSIVNAFNQTASDGVKDTQSGFRAFNKDALRLFTDMSEDGFGVETEQLSIARKFGLRIMEVPTTIRYEGLENTSKKDPVSHGLELIMVALKLMVQDKPLLMIGLPGLLFILTSLFTGYLFVRDFQLTNYFSVPMALITFTFLTIGTLLILSSLIFYALYLLKMEIKRLRIDK
jgi:glycosyltransferase involved in cell wall biosynthesis